MNNNADVSSYWAPVFDLIDSNGTFAVVPSHLLR